MAQCKEQCCKHVKESSYCREVFTSECNIKCQIPKGVCCEPCDELQNKNQATFDDTTSTQLAKLKLHQTRSKRAKKQTMGIKFSMMVWILICLASFFMSCCLSGFRHYILFLFVRPIRFLFSVLSFVILFQFMDMLFDWRCREEERSDL